MDGTGSEIESEALELIREFDEQFQRQWSNELDRCERNGDIEKMLRMEECDLSVLEKDFTDLIPLMTSGELNISEFNAKLEEARVCVADLLDTDWIFYKKAQLVKMISRMNKVFADRPNEVMEELKKRYSIVSKLIMS